jgi:hypothetical protein
VEWAHDALVDDKPRIAGSTGNERLRLSIAALTPAEQVEFERLVRDANGPLCDEDHDSVIDLAQLRVQAQGLRQQLRREGVTIRSDTSVKAHPAIAALKVLSLQVRRLERTLGLGVAAQSSYQRTASVEHAKSDAARWRDFVNSQPDADLLAWDKADFSAWREQWEAGERPTRHSIEFVQRHCRASDIESMAAYWRRHIAPAQPSDDASPCI